jgi:RNA recognition motif-containing protein
MLMTHDPNSGRSSGQAFVEFKTVDEASTAIREKNKSSMGMAYSSTSQLNLGCFRH